MLPDATAEIHGFSQPDATPTPWAEGLNSHPDSGGRAIVFRVRPVRGLGFRKGETFSRTTWRFRG